MMDPFWAPVVWFAFIAFLGGSLFKLVAMARLAKKERVVFPTMDAKFGLRSVFHWIVPFNSRNMRLRPLFTVISFAFHISLLATPLFVMGHAVLWQSYWNVRWWSLPSMAADVMALVVVLGGLFFLLRRISSPEVRYVSAWSDYALVCLVVAPFLTGFIAHQQLLPYRVALTAHIVSGVLWLVAIPFTRLAHMLWFLFTRIYMGSEFGAVRHARDW